MLGGTMTILLMVFYIQTHGEDRYEWTPIHISWDEKLFGVQSSHLQTTGTTRGWLGCLGSGFHENVFFVKATVVGGWMIFVGHPETGATLSFPRFFSKTSGILPASLKIPVDPKNGGHQQTLKRLGSGNSNISMFIPMWGNDPIWWAYFSDGLVEPPTSIMSGNSSQKAEINDFI